MKFIVPIVLILIGFIIGFQGKHHCFALVLDWEHPVPKIKFVHGKDYSYVFHGQVGANAMFNTFVEKPKEKK